MVSLTECIRYISYLPVHLLLKISGFITKYAFLDIA